MQTIKQALQNLIIQYKEHSEFITNEETTKTALVAPFISALGYKLELV